MSCASWTNSTSSALVVAGDQKGRVGLGFGKANEVSDAIKKASESSRKDLMKINLLDATIPHEVVGQHGGGHVAAIVISPKAKRNYKSKTLYQHQSLCRLLLQGLGLTQFPGKSKNAPLMGEFF